MAEHQVGRAADQDRQPVGDQAVRQGSHERRAAGHAREDGQAGEMVFTQLAKSVSRLGGLVGMREGAMPVTRRV